MHFGPSTERRRSSMQLELNDQMAGLDAVSDQANGRVHENDGDF